MKLRFEYNGEITDKESVLEDDLENAINRLGSVNVPYIILENENGDYIQCMSGDKGFVAEVRFYDDEKTFKHYVIGQYPVSNVWNTVHGTVGPINVLGNEILEISNVRELFEFFIKRSEVQKEYSKRNITKMFLR